MNCKKCNSEMYLMDGNDILNYWEYACSNDDCPTYATIDDRYDEIFWDEE